MVGNISNKTLEKQPDSRVLVTQLAPFSDEIDEPIRNMKEFEAFVFSQSDETHRALRKIVAYIFSNVAKE